MEKNTNFIYKNLSPFKWFVLENFPFIEADFDALTEWQLFCKLGKEINKIIDSQNIVGEQAETLTNAFNNLKNYIDNYFNNLDVQNEINNKLDEMAQDGTLNKLVGIYINPYLSQFDEEIENQNEKINNLNNKINSATNGNPLVASSIEDMTDTTKIYVNTSDGKWYYYNGENWIIGGTYQSNVEGSYQLYTSDRFEPYYNGIRPLYNMINNSSFDENKYYYNNNGTIEKRSANNYYTFDKFPVKGGETYQLYENNNPTGNIANAFSYLVNPDGTVIETLTGTNIHQFTPSQDGYVYMTVTGDYDYSNAGLYIFDKQPTAYTEYNIPYNFIINNTNYNEMYNFYDTLKNMNIAKTNEIFVGPNQYFTSIKDAIASINDASKTNIYDIIIDDGTYEETNINLPNFVNLKGKSGLPENCIIKGYLPQDSIDSLISGTSTINMNYNNELHNLTITGQNLRYPIHNETNGNFKDWKQIVNNCIIEHLGNQEVINYRIENNLDYDNVWSSCHAWGEGSSSGANLIMENCIIKSVETPFYVHAAPNMEKNYYHKLKNCRLITTDLNSIFIDDTTSPLNNNTLIVENCFLNGRIAIVGTKKYNMLISGSGLKPIYQKPERVLDNSDFPIFTDYLQQFIAGEDIPKGTFVYTIDGLTLLKANSTTPLNQILGYTIGNHTSGELVKVMKGFMQPLSQKWPEEPIESGNKLSLDDNGKIKISTSINDIIIGITQNRWYKLFI